MYPIPSMGHRFFVNRIMIIEQMIATVPTITVYISLPSLGVELIDVPFLWHIMFKKNNFF